jgi:hypothetical protein
MQLVDSSFRPTGAEHFLLACHYDRERPWRKVEIELPQVIICAKDVLAAVGCYKQPQLRLTDGQYIVDCLPQYECFCRAQPWESHKMFCQKLRQGVERAWSALIAGTYGTGAPYRSPSPWFAAVNALEALQQFGYSYAEALNYLGISADVEWFEYYRTIVDEHRYHFELTKAEYAAHPEWLQSDLSKARQRRQELGLLIPEALRSILN